MSEDVVCTATKPNAVSVSRVDALTGKERSTILMTLCSGGGEVHSLARKQRVHSVHETRQSWFAVFVRQVLLSDASRRGFRQLVTCQFSLSRSQP